MLAQRIWARKGAPGSMWGCRTRSPVPLLATAGLYAGPRPTHVCEAASVGHSLSVLRIPCSGADVGYSVPGKLTECTSGVIPHPTHRFGDGGVESWGQRENCLFCAGLHASPLGTEHFGPTSTTFIRIPRGISGVEGCSRCGPCRVSPSKARRPVSGVQVALTAASLVL